MEIIKKITSLNKPKAKKSLWIVEAKVVQFFKKNNLAIVQVLVNRQIGCGQKNCCSSLFNDWLKPNSSLNLTLNKEQNDLYQQGHFKEKQNIKLAINSSWLMTLVVAFYFLPLISFIASILLAHQFTNSPLLLFLVGLTSLVISLFLVKKGFNFSISKQLQFIL